MRAASDTTVVRRVVRETATNGARRVCLVADGTAVYRVAVLAADGTTPRRYTLRVADVRPATDADRKRSEALSEMIEAEHLYADRSADGYRGAVTHGRTSAQLWTETGDRLEAAHAWHRLALAAAALSAWPAALEADDQGQRRSAATCTIR